MYYPGYIVGAAPTLQEVKQVISSTGYIGSSVLGAVVAALVGRVVVFKNQLGWESTAYLAIIYAIIFWLTGAVSMYVSAKS